VTATGARELSVTDSDVHVWWIDDSGPCDGLAPDEVDHAARFRHDGARRRFAARRAWLRRILGAYLDVDPTVLEFDRSCLYCGDPSHGRPRLVGDADLSFSTASRSGHVVVAVATAAMSVGVDVETTERFDAATIDIRGVALTAEERQTVDQGDTLGIARLWCRKEAALKAMGLGIGGRAPATLTRMVAISQNHRAGFHHGSSRQRRSCWATQLSTGWLTCSSIRCRASSHSSFARSRNPITGTWTSEVIQTCTSRHADIACSSSRRSVLAKM
jgi:phosphopantetheinyl transferase